MSLRYIAARTVFAAITGILLCFSQANAEVLDRIVAVVNDDMVTLSELDIAVAIESAPIKGGVAPERAVEFKSAVLDALIEGKLMKQYAEKIGIEVSEKEIDNAIEDVKKNNNFTHENLLVALTQSGVTLREYREQMREDIRRSKFMDKMFRPQINITDEDVRDYYLQNIKDMGVGEEFRLRVLLIANLSDKKAMDAKLKAVEEELRGGTAFEDVVRKYSDGPAVNEGGDMGFLDNDNIDPVLAETAHILNKGQVSGPIEVRGDVFMLQLIEKRPKSVRTYEETKDVLRGRLYSKLMQQKYASWIEEMKRVSYIDIRL